jgi:hypothetical protein
LLVWISSVFVICVCLHLVVVGIADVDMLNLGLPAQTLFVLNSALLAIELVFVAEVYYTVAQVALLREKMYTNDWPVVVLHKM